MEKITYQIILHREHKTPYCDIVAIQAAEMNGQINNTVTVNQFAQMIDRNLKEHGELNTTAIVTYEKETDTMYLDVKMADGKFYTGATLKKIPQ